MVCVKPNLKRVYVGMQCFWGAESTFAKLSGVRKTKVGYTGGSTLNPSYSNIGDHTEVVELCYDENMCSLTNILTLFFLKHDSTFKYKRQYESSIFYLNEEQRQLAEKAIINEQNKQGSVKIVGTRLKKLDAFYPAENYHQKYWLRCQQKIFHELKLTDEEIAGSVLATKLNAYLAGYDDEFAELKILESKYNLSEKIINNLLTIIKNNSASRACH